MTDQTAQDSQNLATIERVSDELFRADSRRYDAVGIKGAEWAGTEGRKERDAILDDARSIARSVEDDIMSLPQPFRFTLGRALHSILVAINDDQNKAG